MQKTHLRFNNLKVPTLSVAEIWRPGRERIWVDEPTWLVASLRVEQWESTPRAPGQAHLHCPLCYYLLRSLLAKEHAIMSKTVLVTGGAGFIGALCWAKWLGVAMGLHAA